MKRFADVLDWLTTTPQRNGKIALLVDYFRVGARSRPRPMRSGRSTDGLFRSLPLRRALAS